MSNVCRQGYWSRCPVTCCIQYSADCVRMVMLCMCAVNVSGLADDGIESLRCLTLLSELAVVAPQNRAVTQASMHALAPLRNLR